jgi:hypothetical protein
MAVESTGNISIKTAAGSGRSIDTDGRTDITSGSLVALSTGNVVTSGNTIDGNTPHGMREFAGYTHTWSTTGTVDEVTIGKTVRYVLDLVDLSPDNIGGEIKNDGVLTYPGGNGIRIQWGPVGAETLNTNWTSLKIGATEGSATTHNRSSFTAITGSGYGTHYIQAGNFIDNTDNATMYFEFIA